jgi:hypothetical protein
MPGSSDSEVSARDAEMQRIQSESRELLESQPAASDRIVRQLEDMMNDKSSAFAQLDEEAGQQGTATGAGADTQVRVTPLLRPLGEAASAAAGSSATAGASSAAMPAPLPRVQERLKSIHKGPNLTSSRRRTTGGAAAASAGGGAEPATPAHSSLLMPQGAPPTDVSALLLPPPAAPGSKQEVLSFRATGRPMHDALLVASDPAVHSAGPGAASAAAAAAAAGVGVTTYLAATPVDPDLNTWADLGDIDAEIISAGLLLSEDESKFKQEAWLEIHKDFLAEQEEKKATAAAEAEASQTIGPDGLPIPRRQYKKKVRWHWEQQMAMRGYLTCSLRPISRLSVCFS